MEIDSFNDVVWSSNACIMLFIISSRVEFVVRLSLSYGPGHTRMLYVI